MLHLLYTAKNSQGEAVRGFVEAASAPDAMRKLVDEGHTDVVFHQDAASAEDAAALSAMSAAEMDDLARFKLQVMQRPGLLTVWREVARRGGWSWACLLVVFVGGAWIGSAWIMRAALAILLLPFAASAWSFRHSQNYQALLRAAALGDGPTVERLARQLRPVSAKTKGMAFDLDVRVAAVRARAGGLDEAIASLQEWREPMAAELPMFECRLASVYGAAGDRAGFVASMRRAYALAPNDPSRALDLALAEARFGDVDQAQAVFDSVDISVIPAFGAGFVLWTRGACQLRRADPRAHDTLGLAVVEFLKLAQQPAVWTALAFCTCDHSIALSFAGHHVQAKRELETVWPVVRAHADAQLMTLLRAQALIPGEMP